MKNFRIDPKAKPLSLTQERTDIKQGEFGIADFIAGTYPACSLHGAMNRVSNAQLWRCLNCNIGAEWIEPKMALRCVCGTAWTQRDIDEYNNGDLEYAMQRHQELWVFSKKLHCAVIC